MPQALAGLPRLQHLILDGNPLLLDAPGAAVLRSLPRLWKLSARVKTPPTPPQQPGLAECGSGANGSNKTAAAAATAPTRAEAGAAMRGGGEFKGAPLALPPLPQPRQRQLWRELAAQLAAQHAHAVLSVEGL